MKFVKAIALMLAVALLCACFAGCAGSENGGGEAGAKILKIGATGPLTGSNAVYGTAVRNGAQLAVDEINAAGGINGMQIEFRMEDDESDAEKAVNAYNTVKDWGMQFFMGTVTTTPCLAVIEQTKADQIFQITPSASAVEVIANDNTFQVCFTDPNQGIASADFIADHNIASKVAVIYNSSGAYSTGIYNNFKAQAETKGIEIVAVEAFTDDSNTDFTAQITKAKEAGAELVFLPIYASEAAPILKQANDMSYNPIFFGCDGLDGLLAIEGFDKTLAEGTMLLTPFAKNAADEATVKFVESYRAAGYDEEVLNQFAADGYDAIYTIKAAAEKAGVSAEMTNAEICAAMVAAMPQISVDGVTGSGMTWKATGEVSKEPKANKIVNGEYQPME